MTAASSGGNERKAPAPLAADDLTDVKIKKEDDFAEEFPPELPTMSPYASVASTTATASLAILNNDDRELAHDDGGARLANASHLRAPIPRTTLYLKSPSSNEG